MCYVVQNKSLFVKIRWLTMQRIWDWHGMLFVRSEEEVPSGDGRVKESPSKEKLDTDAEESLANAEVQGRGG